MRRRSRCGPVREYSGPVERLEGRTLLATFTVTTTADEGPGSLRQAMLDANATGGLDLIQFNIPPGQPGAAHTIALRSPLPAQTAPVNIDGSTQPGYAGSPLIEIDGSGAGANADGFSLRFTSVLRGLAINRFGRHGVVVDGSSTIESNYIGTDATGTADLGNGGAGVVVSGSGAAVGGARALGGPLGRGNVISGNGLAGVWILGTPLDMPLRVTVSGNHIGTNAAGDAALGNDAEGVLVGNGADARLSLNVISGNGASGVRVLVAATGTLVQANHIGTNAAGTAALGNGASAAAPFRDGITSDTVDLTVGGPQDGLTTSQRNVISGNAGAGVRVFHRNVSSARGLQVLRNYVGTDAAGSADLGNGSHGLWLSDIGPGGGALVAGNVVAGNGGDGVRADAGDDTDPGSGVTVSGNFIGTSAAGTAALGNGGHGVNVLGPVFASVGGQPFRPRAPGSPVVLFLDAGNVISANGGSGVNAADAPAGNPNAVQGPFALLVQGNFIGTDAAGNADFGNGGNGVSVDADVAGVLPAEARVLGNLVSGNAGDGVLLANVRFSRGPVDVGGNFVGTNAAGTAAVANGGDGIELRDSRAQRVGAAQINFPRPGGVDPLATGRNVVSGNGGNGIAITGDPTVGVLSGHQVMGNYVGTNAAGTGPLPNRGSGVYVDGPGPHRIGEFVSAANLISGNAGDGVTLGPAASGVQLRGNFIGTTLAIGPTAPAPLGNGGHGVAVRGASGNIIGGGLGGNTVAFNAGSGVYVEGAAARDNQISANAIYSNGRLGIDLADGKDPAAGVTPNDPLDADTGPNGLQNYPVITSATSTIGALVVRFTLSAEPDRDYVVEFFTSQAPDPSGYGEGMNFRGSTTVRTDAEGNAVAVRELYVPVLPGLFVTTTARPAGPGGGVATGTSEFSNAVRAAAPTGPAVVRRHVFYNHSAFDGNDPAAGASDDAAVATDKRPLLPGGGPAGFTNVTTYARGINGVMIDVQNLPAAAETSLGPEDFVFRSGNGPDATAWAEALPPMSVSVRRGAGVGGADRVTLVWADYNPASDSPFMAAANRWLEVTVKANADTGLSAPDVFYFGNLIGDAGDAATAPLRVNALDLAAVRRALNTESAVAGTFDFNRDGRVNALDLAAVRRNLGRELSALVVPAAASVAGMTADREEDPLLA